LSLTFFKNEIVCFVGHKNSGKTVVADMLSGIINPTSGYISFHKENGERKINWHKHVGHCPKETILMEKLTASENLMYIALLRKKKTMEKYVHEVLVQMSLVHVASKQVKFLTENEKRKLQVGMAIVARPQVVVLDEPTVNVDGKTRAEIWDALKVVKRNCIVIVTTSSMIEAQVLSDRIGLLSKGELKACGTSIFLQ
jgi:ABC-type multidrug transport system ATPase subunit